jgi:hypothetical protein
MATSDDFRWPTTEGQQPNSIARLMHWYLDRVMQVASERAEAHQVFAEVVHMVKPPTAFFQPRILTQVLQQAIKRQPGK